jgi:hypothetical protein
MDIAKRIRAVNLYRVIGKDYVVERFFIEVLNDQNQWVPIDCADRSVETGLLIDINHPPFPAARLGTAKAPKAERRLPKKRAPRK